MFSHYLVVFQDTAEQQVAGKLFFFIDVILHQAFAVNKGIFFKTFVVMTFCNISVMSFTTELTV